MALRNCLCYVAVKQFCRLVGQACLANINALSFVEFALRHIVFKQLTCFSKSVHCSKLHSKLVKVDQGYVVNHSFGL